MTTTNATEVRQIDVQAAFQRSQSPDVRVVDIRMPFDYAGDRIPGSLNLPNNAIRVRKAEVPDDKEVIFVSEDGERSLETCRIASSLGFPKVLNLEGGFDAWLAAGLPTETNSEGVQSTPPPSPPAT
jgi:rhodanese-related sulfurtransferase